MPSMNVSLTPELMKYVQGQVKSGMYNNASEVVRDALRHKTETAEMVYQFKLERLRKALAPGIKALEDGDYTEYSSPEEFMKDMDGKKI